MIPKQFSIFGRTYKVKFEKNLLEETGAWGLHHGHRALIRIQEPEAVGSTPEFTEQIFWHEVAHAIFDSLHLHEMNNDEKLVDNVGACLQQIYKSMK